MAQGLANTSQLIEPPRLSENNETEEMEEAAWCRQGGLENLGEVYGEGDLLDIPDPESFFSPRDMLDPQAAFDEEQRAVGNPTYGEWQVMSARDRVTVQREGLL